MTFQKPKKSLGRLYPNKKTKDLSPHMVGTVQIQPDDMDAFIEQYKARRVVQANIALWFYSGEGDEPSYASVQLSPPFFPNSKPRPSPKEEPTVEDFFRQVARETSQEPFDTD